MKTNKLLVFLLLVFITISAQDFNKIIKDGKTGKSILIGECNRKALVDSNFAWWFSSGYKFYHPDSSVISQLQRIDSTFSITIVMGTWCSDSRREVPRFYRVLDEIKFPKDKVELINVDRKKEAEELNLSKFNIERVPTLIVFSNGSEIGRIIETPKESLEKDLLNIIK